MIFTSYKQLMSDYNKGLIYLNDLFILKDEFDRKLKEFDRRIDIIKLIDKDVILKSDAKQIMHEVFG